jgi:hypothetical protein
MGRRQSVRVARALLLVGVSLGGAAHGSVRLADGHGRLEVQAAAGGKGAGLLAGESLGKGTLVVGPQAHASLQTDDGARLEVEGPARLEVVTATATEVLLASGHLTAEGGSRAVQVKAASGVVSLATGAHFEVALTDDGALHVTSRTGAVQLTQGAAKATVAAGKELRLARGEALLGDAVAQAEAPAAPAAPTLPTPAVKAPPVAAAPTPTAAPPAAPAADAPARLTVKWPKGPVAVGFTLRGQASPGAEVTANGVAAEVRKSGAFSVKLELPEGPSVVQVSTTTQGGKTASDQHEVRAVVPPAESEPKAEAEGASTSKGDKPPEGKPQVKQEGAGWE